MNKLLDNIHSRWLAFYRASPLEQFVSWWTGELRDLAPDALRDWFDHEPEYLLLVPEGERLLVYRAGGDAPKLLERVTPSLEDAHTTRERVSALLANFDADNPRCVVSLRRDTVLIKRLKLPVATSENLSQVLGFEMDRHTPFKADQVYFDYRILARDPKARSITVEMVVTPKAAVDEWLGALKARGFNPDALDVMDQAQVDPEQPPALRGINLLPQTARPKRASAQFRLNAGLAGAAGVLLVFAMWQAMAMRKTRIQVLETRVENERGSAMEVAALRKDLEQAVEAANFLMREKRRQPVLVNVLQEATRILPDHTWLERLQIEDQQVTMLGETPSAAEIIGIIDASPLLNAPSFVSPITTNSNTSKERFNIEATVAEGVSPFAERQAQASQTDTSTPPGSAAEKPRRAARTGGNAGAASEPMPGSGSAAAQAREPGSNSFSNLTKASGNGPSAPRS